MKIVTSNCGILCFSTLWSIGKVSLYLIWCQRSGNSVQGHAHGLQSSWGKQAMREVFSGQVCSALVSHSLSVPGNDHFFPPSTTSNYFMFVSVIYCCTTNHTELSGFSQPCYGSWLFGLAIWAGLGGDSSPLLHIVMANVWGWRIQDGFTPVCSISFRGRCTG